MFDLTEDYVILDSQKFRTVTETNSEKSYFAERIAVRGELAFGLVAKDDEVKISLADNGINTPIIIDSIIAMSGNSTADELIFTLYKIVDGNEYRVGIMRYSNYQMPTDFPDGIIYPDMVVGVRPVRADATIMVYCKPVIKAFTAVPNPTTNE